MKRNIAIIMGGYSSEHEISIQSGNVVYKNIKANYNAFCVHILKDKWVYVSPEGREHTMSIKADFSIRN